MMMRLRTGLAVAAILLTPAAARAQTASADRLSIRPFAMVAAERFSAATTFDAVFGQAVGAFVGGGVVVNKHHLFVEATVSRFSRTGERGFASDDDGFGLDIPLTIVVRPIEFSAGYRFSPLRGSITPYVGGGIGVYRFKETSPSAEPGENVDMSHAGWLLVGGAELRLHRWIALAADLQYTHVPGILGEGGLSQEADEHSLGGVAFRFKVVFGRR